MADEPTSANRSERLARLAQRQSPRSTPSAGQRVRRGHRAGATRILSAGLSTAAFLAFVAAFAARPPVWSAATAAATPPPVSASPSTAPPITQAPPTPVPPTSVPPAPPETIVVYQTVHRTVYVDDAGRPVDPNAAGTTPAAPSPAPAPEPSPAATVPQRATRTQRAVAAPPGDPAPTAPPPPPPAAAPAPTAAPPPPPPPPPPPSCSGSSC